MPTPAGDEDGPRRGAADDLAAAWSALSSQTGDLLGALSAQAQALRAEGSAVRADTAALCAGCAFVAGVGLGLRLSRARPFWYRYSTVSDLPKHLFGEHARMLRGRVAAVSDGDTFRLRHAPTWLHSSRLPAGAKLSEHTLQIRLCAIDAPETAKFGKSGQPFGEAARERLERLIGGRMVAVRLLARDQYGRAVATVRRGWWPLRSYVEEEMARSGHAQVYTGAGGSYGPKGRAHFEALEAAARRARRGLWAQRGAVESPAAYKARGAGKA